MKLERCSSEAEAAFAAAAAAEAEAVPPQQA